MKKSILFFIILSLVLTGCEISPVGTSSYGDNSGLTRYSATVFDLLDTVITVTGYAESETAFNEAVADFHDEMEVYHQLFDIYHTYDGVVNIKTINDLAGKEAVEVNERLLRFLLFCKDMEKKTDHTVDISLGAVLSLWHDAREVSLKDPEKAYVPDTETLKEAYTHTGIDLLEIDEQAGTVRLKDPEARLDVGAIAKGYAAEMCMKNAPMYFLFSVGGNIVSTSKKPDGSDWIIGIQDPDGGAEDTLYKVSASAKSVVSSGDYQRYYEKDGIRYNHIIDPKTLFPAEKYREVSVVAADSGIADALSTALFIMDQDKGEELVKSLQAEAVWIYKDGSVKMTDGFRDITR